MCKGDLLLETVLQPGKQYYVTSFLYKNPVLGKIIILRYFLSVGLEAGNHLMCVAKLPTKTTDFSEEHTVQQPNT